MQKQTFQRSLPSIWSLVCLLALISLAQNLYALEPGNVLIVANKDFEGSLDIASYYAELRDIPKDQILTLSTSQEEEITREEFNASILSPLKAYIQEHPEILVIVPTRGIPLKIQEVNTENDSNDLKDFIATRDFAAVDSELALIRRESYDLEGAIESNYFRSEQPLTKEDQFLIVSRLDGPSTEIAKSLVEKAILAETLGPSGNCFLDTMDVAEKDGSYYYSDQRMMEVGETWEEAGFVYTHDPTPTIVDLSTKKDLLHYCGWYVEHQKPKKTPRFRTGAIAYHLHSFSAARIRVTHNYWVGPLLSWGATGSFGTVYEPLTSGIPYENIFWQRFCAGYSYGEAGAMSNRRLSWQTVFVGDPLYTPYKKGWLERAKENRKKLSSLLLGEEFESEEENKVLEKDLEKITALLQNHIESLLKLFAEDKNKALPGLQKFRGLLAGFELDHAIAQLLEPFEDMLDKPFSELKSKLSKNPKDVADLEEALEAWQGFSIYKKLTKLHEDIQEEHQKEVKSLLKKGQRALKSKSYLRAWQQAKEALSYFYGEGKQEAQGILESIENNEEAKKELQEEADKELQKLGKEAQKLYDKERYKKVIEKLEGIKETFPECEERTKLLELFEKAEKESKKDS